MSDDEGWLSRLLRAPGEPKRSELLEEVARLRREAREADEERTRLAAQNERLQVELAESTAEREALASRMAEQIEVHEGQRVDLLDRLELAEARAREAQAKIQRLHAELDRARSPARTDVLQARVVALEQALVDATNAHDRAAAASARLESEHRRTSTLLARLFGPEAPVLLDALDPKRSS